MVIDVPVVLSGYGPVGRAYATELAERGAELAAAYGVRPYVVAVRGATGEYRTEPGVAGAGAASGCRTGPGVAGAGATGEYRTAPGVAGAGVASGCRTGPGVAGAGAAGECRTGPGAAGVGAVVPGRAEWGVVSGFAGLLDEVRPVVFAQAVPSSAEVAPVAAAEALAALRRGVHVVTATKGHLLSDWRALRDAARGGGAELRFSGATGAALPAGDVARDSLLGFGCRAIRACPNGTSTYVLDLMAGGATLDEALADARRRGIAEADPAADLSGADAATKVRLLTGLAWDWDVTATAVRLTPIAAATATVAQAAAADGRRLRAVATARADRPGEVTVDLAPTAPGDPLHAITGPGKAVVFDCGDAGEITVSGGRSSPRGAALAMLKDTLAVAAAR